MIAIFALLRPFLPYIIGAIAIVGAVTWFGAHERGIGAAKVQAKWNADTARRIKLTTDITNMYAGKALEADERERKLNEDRNRRMAVATVAAKNLPRPVADVVVPAPAVVILRDAVTAGNTADASPAAAESTQAAASVAADSDVGTLTQWGVAVIAVCVEYRDRALGLAAFYESLRPAQ